MGNGHVNQLHPLQNNGSDIVPLLLQNQLGPNGPISSLPLVSNGSCGFQPYLNEPIGCPPTFPIQQTCPFPVPVPIRIPVPVPVRVPFPVPVKIPVPVPHPVRVEVRVPYEVRVPVPHPVRVPVRVPVPVQVPVPYQVPVKVSVPVQVPEYVKVPVSVKIPVQADAGVSTPQYGVASQQSFVQPQGFSQSQFVSASASLPYQQFASSSGSYPYNQFGSSSVSYHHQHPTQSTSYPQYTQQTALLSSNLKEYYRPVSSQMFNSQVSSYHQAQQTLPKQVISPNLKDYYRQIPSQASQALSPNTKEYYRTLPSRISVPQSRSSRPSTSFYSLEHPTAQTYGSNLSYQQAHTSATYLTNNTNKFAQRQQHQQFERAWSSGSNQIPDHRC